MDRATPGESGGEASVHVALGRRVRELRTERGWSQLRLAELAVEGGLVDWRRPLIANLEAGDRRLDLGEVLTLASVFEVPVADLLPANAVHVTEHRVMRHEQVLWYLSGGHDGVEDHSLVLDADVGYFAWRLSRYIERAEALSRAAHSLGMEASEVEDIAHRLWGTGLVAERDRRLAELPGTEQLSARSRQARRGHITRSLLTEIRQAQEG